MSHVWRMLNRRRRLSLALIVLTALLLLGGAATAFAGPAASDSHVQWRNEGFSDAKGWTTGEIGPYDEGSLVPFRFTVTNPSNTKSAVVGGFSLQVTSEAHGVAVFDGTTDWTGPLAPSSQDGVFGDMLRTTFPAGLTLAPGQSATFTFNGHLATSTASRPAAGMLNGNGVCGFSEIDADGVGSFGKRVPVKVNARAGLLGTPAIDLAESSDAPSSGVPAGMTVNFIYVVTNIGDVTLYNASVSDAQLGAVGMIPGSLEPGESRTLHATRVLTETIADSASVVAVDGLGREATDTEEFTVSVFSSARVFGSVFEDRDYNGAWDAGEPGLPGFAVELSDAFGNPVAIAITDGIGGYSFADVTPGQGYSIAVTPQSMWYGTAPIGGMFSITPAPGQDAGPYDFGEYTVAEE